MRLELRFPETDHAHDALLEAQIRAAVTWVANDTGVDLLGLAVDDPDLPAFQIGIVLIARALYDGVGRMPPQAYDALIGPLRRFA